MNIEIANRLVELRKKYGYSQEELASKLGLSRQAVSKWERAESSPDTDNLICLARLYNISLDELLKTSDTTDDIINTNKALDSDDKVNKNENGNDKAKAEENNKAEANQVRIDKNGIYVKDNEEGESVFIGINGIHVKSADREFHLGSKSFDFPDTISDDSYLLYKKHKKLIGIISGIILLLSVISYICYGAILNCWHPSWIIVLIGLTLIELTNDIISRRFNGGSFLLFIVVFYLVLGFYFNLWHPGWVAFLFIPVYYLVVPKNHKKITYRNKDGILHKSFEDKYDKDVIFDDEIADNANE